MTDSTIVLWRNICQALLLDEGYGEKLLGKFFIDVMLSQRDFQRFFNHVVAGKFHQHSESHFFHMPENVIEDEQEGFGKYEGCMKISWNNFDDQEHVGFVRLDKFCFYVKLAAIFHAQHVDGNFIPWERFPTLDEMQNRYFPYFEV